MKTYAIGRSTHQILRSRVTGAEEAAALDRLLEHRGTAFDLRIAASLHLQRDERHQAAELLRMLAPEDDR